MLHDKVNKVLTWVIDQYCGSSNAYLACEIWAGLWKIESIFIIIILEKVLELGETECVKSVNPYPPWFCQTTQIDQSLDGGHQVWPWAWKFSAVEVVLEGADGRCLLVNCTVSKQGSTFFPTGRLGYMHHSAHCRQQTMTTALVVGWLIQLFHFPALDRSIKYLFLFLSCLFIICF